MCGTRPRSSAAKRHAAHRTHAHTPPAFQWSEGQEGNRCRHASPQRFVQAPRSASPCGGRERGHWCALPRRRVRMPRQGPRRARGRRALTFVAERGSCPQRTGTWRGSHCACEQACRDRLDVRRGAGVSRPARAPCTVVQVGKAERDLSGSYSDGGSVS